MSAKLGFFYKRIVKNVHFGAFFILISGFFNGFAQDCPQNPLPSFTPTTINNHVNWQQFPEFSLPFKVIYGGQASFSNPEIVLKRGFSHLATPHDISSVQKSQRAMIYSGTAYPNRSQPWEIYKGPWGNDMSIYTNKWAAEFNYFKQITGNQATVETDLFVYDIERQQRSNDSILVLKNMATTPVAYRSLSNDNFIEQYKKSLQELYATAVNFGKNGPLSASTQVSSYADTPIWNTFTNILGYTWTQWKQNPAVINYLTYNFGQNQVGGAFYNALDFLTPSAYYYYDYPHPFASEYLSYLLFQIEANRAWSTKDNIVFVWMKYSFNQDYKGKFIKPWMAEATAIFPFFAGAKGLWLWDDFTGQNQNYSTYEYFMKGLYRLSLFKHMFTGSYERIEETSARDYNENKKPIWRGVVKGSNILVATHNPYAKTEDELVTVLVTYKNWSKVIQLKGYEVFLCQYDLNAVTGLEPSGNIEQLSLYPNPAVEDFTVEFSLKKTEEIKVFVHDLQGRLIDEHVVEGLAGTNTKKIGVKGYHQLIVTVMTPKEQLTKRIIVK
jgi:hypothetical protein